MTDVPPQPPQSPQQPGGPHPIGQQPPPPGMPVAPAQPAGYVPFGTQPPAMPPTPPSGGLSVAMGAAIVVGAVVAVVAAAGLISGASGGSGDDTSTVQATTPVITTPDVSIPEVSVPDVTVPDATVSPVETEPREDEPVEDEPVEDEPVADEPVDDEPVVTDPPESDSSVPTGDAEPPADDTVLLTELAQLLAWTSFSEELLDEAAAQVEIDQLIATQTVEAVAHPTAVATICAGIPMDAPIDLAVTWQYEGETVQVDAFEAEPPGVGTCLSNDGAPLGAGSYQVFASNDDETEVGFVTTFVVGATEVAQTFVNNTEFDICDIGIAPLSTAYYEFFTSTRGPIRPGEIIRIAVASIDQDLRVRICDGDDLDNLTFSPNGSVEQPMAES